MRRFRTLPTTAVVTTRAGSTRRSSPPPRPENATARQAQPDAGSEFKPLLRDVKGLGLLDRRPGWYARTIATNALGLAAIVTGMALIGGSWWVVALASVLTVLCARTAFSSATTRAMPRSAATAPPTAVSGSSTATCCSA